MLIQKLRLKRGWSQQQLAEVSGLSTRTIQRLEAGHPPSTESLKSLAAAFEVEFSTLKPEPEMNVESNSGPEKEEREAFRHVRKLKAFYIHLFQYVMVIGFLAIINIALAPGYLWVLWVAAGWGFGVLVHAFGVFRPAWFLGPQWERAEVEKRLGRPL
jgi:transcriptional regulator with XRE-family HTH domain